MQNIKAVAFDLDGTIYQGNQIIEGAADLIRFLKGQGRRVFYFTNNSTRTRIQIFEKLLKFGLELNVDEVYNSAYATAIYAKMNEINSVYCIGSEGLIEELKSAGITETSDAATVKALIIGLDTEFSYYKITKALSFLRKKECLFIVCNRDRNYPVEDGRLMPGCGSIVAAIEEACERKADFIVGKPNTFMIEILAKDWGLRNADILVIGDSYDSDIEMAKKFRSLSVLISKYEKPSITDTIVVENIREIRHLFEQ